jgi:hypothetical protein
MFLLIFAFLVGNLLFASHTYATVPARKVMTVFNRRLRAKYLFEVRHPRCVSVNHKIKQQTLVSQNTTILYILYI